MGRAYQDLHPTFVKSFAIDALLELESAVPAEPHVAGMDQARDFLAAASQCTVSEYPSIGYGVDHRLEAPKVAGAALVSHEHVVQLTLFSRN